jgi:hypothetical protein
MPANQVPQPIFDPISPEDRERMAAIREANDPRKKLDDQERIRILEKQVDALKRDISALGWQQAMR